MPASPSELRLGLRPSRRLRQALHLAHAGVFAVLLLADMPFALTLAGLAAVAALWPWHLRRYRRPAVDSLIWRDDAWFVPGVETPLSLEQSWQAPWLAVLRLRGETGSPLDVVLLPDMMGDAEWRRLAHVLRGFA